MIVRILTIAQEPADDIPDPDTGAPFRVHTFDTEATVEQVPVNQMIEARLVSTSSGDLVSQLAHEMVLFHLGRAKGKRAKERVILILRRMEAMRAGASPAVKLRRLMAFLIPRNSLVARRVDQTWT